MTRFSVEDRIREAYVAMAMQANYRPESSGSASAHDDLTDESASYTKRFIAEE
jgi:hypothetical protein